MISKSISALAKHKPELKEASSEVPSPPLAEPFVQSRSEPLLAALEPSPSLRITASPRSNKYGWLIRLSVKLVVFSLLAAGAYFGRSYLEKFKPYVERFWKVAAKPEKPPPRAVTVVTAPVKRGNMSIYLNGLGTITAFQTVTVRSRVEGELIRIAFTEGQMVQEGDLLAEIDSRPYKARLQQAEGQLAKDEATVKGAKLTLDRSQKLFNSQSITAQQIDEQSALVGQAEGAVLADRAIIEDAKLQVIYSRILAPITGRIGLRLVDQGNIVRVNDPTGIAVITQLQPITMTFTVPQDDIARVQAQNKVDNALVVEAYNRDFDMKLATGKLLAIDNQVDVTTGTVRIKAIFENKDNMLFPNQFVNARLLVDELHDAVIVPTAAVQHGPDFDFVYVVNDEDKVDLQTVKAGISEGESTVITSGLTEGQTVVTGGMDKLQRGSKIVRSDKKPSSGDAPKQASGQPRDAEPVSARPASPNANAFAPPQFGEQPIETKGAPTSVSEASPQSSAFQKGR